tara:strand:+ start:341 stop:598 length:258 start_codon:yes stop_codon:yes gene_type:complete
MNKDILNALADALMGSGSAEVQEAKKKWYMCISDGQGGHQTYEAHDVLHAEAMARQWLATGWPAWVQDEEGRALVMATKPRGEPN